MGSRPVRGFFLIILLALLSILAAPLSLHAQPATAPAHISAVEGTATLDSETTSEAAIAGAPFIPGDRINTSAGRVEVVFPDGSSLAIDEYSTVDMQSETLLRLVAGRVLLNVAGAADPERAVRYQIDTPVASASNAGPGEYRLTLLTGRTELEVELAVLRGTGSLVTEQGSMLVRSGERTLAADNTPPSFPESFNSARLDDFDRWAAARRNSRIGPALSAQYLPQDLRVYSTTFDHHGAWAYEAAYGYVWYPTVATAWRPYYNGYWRSLPRHGWTWIAHDPWGWPTHHYGRWGHVRNRWFWIPDRHFGPAWVSWASAPGFVSWCPLGFNNRPVFALSRAFGSPWRGWAVLPRTHFGVHRTYVTNNFFVAPHRLPSPTTFVVHNTAPIPPARAIPRPGSAARTGSGNAAVPRNAVAPGQPSLAETARRTNALPNSGATGANAVTGGARAINRTPAPDQTFKRPLPEPTAASGARSQGRNSLDATRTTPEPAATDTSPVRALPRNRTLNTAPAAAGTVAPGARNRRAVPLQAQPDNRAGETTPPPASNSTGQGRATAVPRAGGANSVTRGTRGDRATAVPAPPPQAATPPPVVAPPSAGTSSGRAVQRNAPATPSAPPPSAASAPRNAPASGAASAPRNAAPPAASSAPRQSSGGSVGTAPAGARNSGRSR